MKTQKKERKKIKTRMKSEIYISKAHGTGKKLKKRKRKKKKNGGKIDKVAKKEE